MRRALVLVVLSSLLVSLVPAASKATQTDLTCASFDAWVWAQTVLDTDPEHHRAALDPDGDGIACPDLPITGFAPTLWADGIPADAEQAQIMSVTDGDTIRVSVDGVEDRVRLYHIDAPETRNPNMAPQCGGTEATAFMEYVLGFAPNGTVWLEYDQTQRDRYDRRLAYVWFELKGEVYLVNEVLVRTGWAESQTYKPDVRYRTQLNEAEQFSVEKVLGVRLLCGKFGQPLDAQPSPRQIAEARRMQPDQEQFAAVAPTPPPAPSAPQPPAGNGQCDPSYPDVCIPPVSVAGDLNCKDIPHRRFTVLPPDPHRFDGDGDGFGCER